MCTYVLIYVHPKLKILYFTNQLSKLNFDYTVMFLTTRSSKLDHTRLYLDDIFLKKYFYLFWNIFYFGIILSCFGIFYLVLEQFAFLEYF